jgi:2-oxoglutarate dehydrogenase E1 component
MLQRHTLRRLRCATGRSRLPLIPQQGPRLLYRDLATAAVAPSPNDPFANGTNTHYAEEMYRHWRQDPSSVHASWDAYFSGLEKGLGPNAFQAPPKFLPAPADGAPALHAAGGAQLDDHLKVRTLVDILFNLKADHPRRCNC